MKLRIWNKTLHIDDDLVAEYQKTSYCVAKSVSAIPDYEYMHLAETSGANESSSGRELKKQLKTACVR